MFDSKKSIISLSHDNDNLNLSQNKTKSDPKMSNYQAQSMMKAMSFAF